ncbi:MAG TPA: HlyD family secretion protein [Kofleriaceae bacterium]|jgi:membrane fusion protein (multidrug efflux system)
MATAETRPTNGTPEAPKATVVAPVPKKKKATRAYLLLAGLALAAVGIYFVHGYITRDEVETDDAQVDADVVPISTRVTGVILKMGVQDNQQVQAGQVIAQIDDADYKAKVAAAQADLDAATAQAQSADAQVDITKSTSGGALSSAKAMLAGQGASVRSAAAQTDAAQAQVARAKAELIKAQADLDRAKKLHDAGAVSGQSLESAQATRDSEQAALDAANANLAAAHDAQAQAVSRVAEAQGRVEQSTPVDRQIASATAAAALAHARVDSARAALDIAKLQLGYTKIVAPTAGTVSRLGAHEGQMVQTGSTLVMIVPATTYVVANFKETQLDRIRPGDPVDIEVDAFGGALHGKVTSVSAGTGARFSMMPPDNATGNFVKVVQRVPVKIAWDSGQDLSQLHAGLSVEVKVHLQH